MCGVSHLKTNQPCQDEHGYALLPGGSLVIAVADGAGSASQAEIGAAAAARAAVEAVQSAFEAESTQPRPEDFDEEQWRALLKTALSQAREALIRESESRQSPLRDFATTLLLAVAGPHGVAAGQIGDGAIVAVDANGEFHTLTIPARGEYVNETTFLTADRALDTMQTNVWRGEPIHLATFSDGLQMLALKLATGEAHRPFFDPLFRFLQQQTDAAAATTALDSFLRSPRIAERADDDLTLVLATHLKTAADTVPSASS